MFGPQELAEERPYRETFVELNRNRTEIGEEPRACLECKHTDKLSLRYDYHDQK